MYLIRLDLRITLRRFHFAILTTSRNTLGEDHLWDKAEREIQEAADERGLKTVAVKGEAAFYGPKLDFMVKDALGRNWQLGTIQVDYQLPQRFELGICGIR